MELNHGKHKKIRKQRGIRKGDAGKAQRVEQGKLQKIGGTDTARFCGMVHGRSRTYKNTKTADSYGRTENLF